MSHKKKQPSRGPKPASVAGGASLPRSPKSLSEREISSPPPSGARKASILWRIYRFSASLSLSVILISTLAGALGGATFYEMYYGTAAVQARVYQAWWFPYLLGEWAVNIFCAAAIRYPWKRHQTG